MVRARFIVVSIVAFAGSAAGFAQSGQSLVEEHLAGVGALPVVADVRERLMEIEGMLRAGKPKKALGSADRLARELRKGEIARQQGSFSFGALSLLRALGSDTNGRPITLFLVGVGVAADADPRGRPKGVGPVCRPSASPLARATGRREWT